MRFAVTLLSLTAVAVVATAGGVVPPLFLLPPRPDADGNPLPPEAVRRLGTSKFLVGNAQKLLYSADGMTVYVGEQIDFEEYDNGVGSVSAWDVATGKQVWRCPERNSVWAMSLSADGNALWVGGIQWAGGYRTVCSKVSVKDGRLVSTQRLSDDYNPGLTVSRTGRATVQTKDGVKVFDPEQAKPIFTLPKSEVGLRFHGVAITPDGSSVVVSEPRGKDSVTPPYHLRCFDPDAGRQRWEAELYPHNNLAVSPDGSTCWITFASGQRGTATQTDMPAQLGGWDVKTGREVSLHELPRSPGEIGMTLSPDGKRALLSVKSKTVLFETATGKSLRTLPDCNFSGGMAISPDGKTLAHGGRILSFQDLEVGTARPGSPEPETSWTEQVRFAADSSIVTLHRRDWSERVYDLRTGKRLEVANKPTPPWGVSVRGWGSDLPFAAVSGDGSLQATVAVYSDANPISEAERGRIRVSRVGEQAEVVRNLPAGSVGYSDLAFSVDGRHVLAYSEFTDALYIWDSGGDAKPKSVPVRKVKDGGMIPNNRIAPSPCGRYVVFRDICTYGGGGKWSFSVYRLPGGGKLKRFDGIGWLMHLAWSADGNRLVGGGTVYEQKKDHGVLFLGDVRAGRESRTIRTPWQVHALALSADGRTAAVGIGAEVQLWEMESYTVRHTFTGLRSAKVDQYGFTPDGRYLVTDTPDGTLVWDVRGELQRFAKPDADELERGWAALAADAPAAFDAIRLLAAHPAESLPFLKRKVAEAKGMSAERIAKLIEQLGDQDFRTREAAEKELLANLDDARAAVEKAATSAAPEVQERAGRLAKKPIAVTPERLRLVRAVEAAEWVGDKDAVLLLRKWATDGPAVLRTEADAALKRLKK